MTRKRRERLERQRQENTVPVPGPVSPLTLKKFPQKDHKIEPPPQKDPIPQQKTLPAPATKTGKKLAQEEEDRKNAIKKLFDEKYAAEKQEVLKEIKISAYTSLSPRHVNGDIQLEAAKSWNEYKMKVFSLNCKEEMYLKKSYPYWVDFIPTNRTTKNLFNKPCVMINAMMDHFLESTDSQVCLLINSDIILQPTEELLLKIKSASEVGLVISSRNDYKREFTQSKKYVSGFDVFFINRKWAHLLPQGMYSMGQTWWDYWIPYLFIKNNIPVFNVVENFAYHKDHSKQYNESDWHKMTQYFKFENNLSEPSSQVINDQILKLITDKSIPL